jgi:hypothetical protein
VLAGSRHRPSYLRPEGEDRLDEAILRIAEAEELTFIVGAGASMEAGLPSWAGLVRQMVLDVAPDLPPEERDLWLGTIVAEGWLPAAAVARVLSPSLADFRERLWQALYGAAGPDGFAPGPLAAEIAAFKRAFPDNVRIITTNYDDLLERALAAAGVPAEGRIDDEPEPSDSAYVRHLHGRLYPDAQDESVVLTEVDYARFSAEPHWQERLMQDVLGSSLCVFVGLSFSDPNIIRWVYSRSARPHLALFTRQSSPALAHGVRRELEHATRARWRVANVDPFWADFYGELAQLLHEARLRRERGRDPDFHARAAVRLRHGRSNCVPEGPRRFPERQREVTRLLQILLDGVTATAARDGVDLEDETLGLALWGCDHENAELSLWAAADRMWAHPSSIVPVPLAYASDWVAVEAVTRGGAVIKDADVYATRWRYVRGVPIVWSRRDGEERLVVGSLTLTSTTPRAESRLEEISPPAMRVIDQLLQTAAVQLWM